MKRPASLETLGLIALSAAFSCTSGDPSGADATSDHLPGVIGRPDYEGMSNHAAERPARPLTPEEQRWIEYLQTIEPSVEKSPPPDREERFLKAIEQVKQNMRDSR